jgi:AAA+ ATPase superfamily predicted ATPase
MLATYSWPRFDHFHNRVTELRRLERWWESDDADVIALSGRRRVGKSWLLHRFAHGKPAVVLVADRIAPGMQLDRLAAQLEPHLGITPRLESASDLVRTLYRLGRDHRVLAVVDEFPYLLGTSAAEQERQLTAVQAVMEEERDRSQLRLVLAGSTLSVMESLQAEKNPLHGRTTPMRLRPLRFAHAVELMPDDGPVDRLQRFAVAGGMPRYLTALGRGSLLDAVTEQIVDPYGPLFNEPLALLSAELREPTTYLSILAALAARPQSVGDVASALHVPSQKLPEYLATLEDLHLVSRHRPVGAPDRARNTQWRCDDDFLRFWFRFVHPRRGDLEAGLDPVEYVRGVVAPALADHVAPTFEQVLRDRIRSRFGAEAPEVGGWWGPALHPLRRAKQRFTEEIDAVGLSGRRVRVVGEAKWTSAPMDTDVLRDLRELKIPALEQAGLAVEGAVVVLASRSGFTPRLVEAARSAGDAELWDVDDVLGA